MSFEESLNIVNNAGKLLRAADVGLKDRIARLIYLNVRVDSDKVVDYQTREPFKTYFKTHKISLGRGLETLFETSSIDELLDEIAQGWNVLLTPANESIPVTAYNYVYEL